MSEKKFPRLRRFVGRSTWRLRTEFQKASRPRALRRDIEISGSRFLFIGGLHRSGTSILHRILSEHPDTSGFRNTGAREDEGQHLQSVFPSVLPFEGPGRFAFEPAASLTMNPRFSSDESRRTLLREWGALYDLSKPVLLEKSPPNLIRADYFRAVFPGCRFVFIIRHPVPVAMATRKWSKSSMLELMFHWAVAHERMLQAYDAKDTIVLRYEDFVVAPDHWLRVVTGHAGLAPFEFTDAVLDKNRSYFEKWSSRCEAQRDLLESAAPALGETFQRWGYRLREPFVEPLPPASGALA